MINKIRKQKKVIRIALFISILVIWYFIADSYNSSIEDNIEKARNFHTLWIISTLLFVFLWIVFFPKKCKTDDKFSEK